MTALKTSGVEDRVEHRDAILPQLAATGVLAREVSRRAHWRIRFGPVRATDIPEYLARGGAKTHAMRHVQFGPAERIEMAIAWAAPAALVLGGATALLRPPWSLPLAALAACLALAVFFIYDRIPGPRRLLLGLGALAIALPAVAFAGGSATALIATAAACAGLVGVLTVDYSGSTPIEGGSLFEERRWHITLDRERCEGVYSCWEVCPEACFEKREGVRKIELAHDERCVKCGACIVQCPMDALFFEDEAGRQVPPEDIRRFKLNMMFRRSVDAGPPQPAP